MSDKTRNAWAVLEDCHKVMQKAPENANLPAIYARAVLAAASAVVAFAEAYEIAHGTDRRRPAENDTETRGDEGP